MPSGTRVRAGTALYNVARSGGVFGRSGGGGSTPSLEAAVSGTLVYPVPADLAARASQPPPPPGTGGALLFCPHEARVDGTCVVCGVRWGNVTERDQTAIHKLLEVRAVVAAGLPPPPPQPGDAAWAVVPAAVGLAVERREIASRGVAKAAPVKQAAAAAPAPVSAPPPRGGGMLASLLSSVQKVPTNATAAVVRSLPPATASLAAYAPPPPATSGGAGGGGGGGGGSSAQHASMRTYKMQHGMQAVISDTVAAGMDASTSAKLRAARKLQLVLDLDHTLIHATTDPRMAAVACHVELGRDVHVFSDAVSTFYVKLRPGLAEFLAAVR